MYDPTIGRWLTRDPVGFNAGDANLYRYVGNNSTNLTDPSGLAAAPALAPAPGTAVPFSYRLRGIPAREEIGSGKSPFELIGKREERDKIEEERKWLNANGTHFLYKVDWILPRTAVGGVPGFIVQKVNARYDFTRKGMRVKGDRSVWEVWYVKADGKVSLAHNFIEESESASDFVRTSIQRWGDKGSFELRLSAVFVPLSQFDTKDGKGRHGDLFFSRWGAPMDSHFQTGNKQFKDRTGIDVNPAASVVEPTWWAKYSANAINRSIKVDFDFTADEKSKPATMTWK